MKFNFKKISAIASSVLLTGMTMGVAAAGSFPAPFKAAGTSGTAVVYGAGADAMDATQANSIASYLASQMPTTGAPSGDSVLLAKPSDALNIGDTWSGTFTGTIDEDELSTLLAEGTYIADDNDEFSYEQKIELGAPTLEHFRDSDYESAAGLNEKTPTVGFKLGSSTYVMNYTLDFTQDAESSIDSNARADDIEGSDIPLMGRSYYVSELLNGTAATEWGKLTLLDSAAVGEVSEGETVTVSGHQVSISYIDADEVVYMVDGERAPASGKLTAGSSYKLNNGDYIGVRDISKLEVSGETGNTAFSIGSGKLEITHGSEIELNDENVGGIKGYVYKTSGGTTTATKINKIVLEWKTDEEIYLSPELEMVMPGFEAVKFTMNELERSEEEKIIVAKDSDTSMELTAPIKDGTVSLNLLFSNASGEFTGLGKAVDDRLLTTSGSTLVFQEKNSTGDDYHSYFVASYNVTAEGESYLLRAKISEDSTNARNETDIEKNVDGTWTTVCKEKIAADTCDIGDVTLTINAVNYTSGGLESIDIAAGTNVVFNRLYTAGGMGIYLPIEGVDTATVPGAINVTNGTVAGYSAASWFLSFDYEDKDDNLGKGIFNLTIDDTSTGALQVSQVNHAGSGGGTGLEIDETSTYEAYMVVTQGEVAPRVLHYTNPDEDYAEVYYPTGTSETSAKVYLTETGSTGTAVNGGSMVFTDAEKASWQAKNVVLVGGSCINSATATALGVTSGTCGSAFTDATGVGAGQYLIKSVDGAFTSGKIALVVAGYEKDDTAAAASRLVTMPATVDTTAGKSYLGVVGATGTSTLTEM
ncbi:hypothetical protein HN832_02585 [archaeon]|jgi:hypothetical protein|nr:hypothetical protein [archaeon]MBT4373241.1 hypothetical protein [archaeon]MBT4531586.1 hypothetical protein [archaeon]MBT7001236.1 hypothetical protein [archaeon]MBT7282278.1 hypothetical protein [archaeon]